MVVGVYCGQRSERALVRILPYTGMAPRGRGECPGARRGVASHPPSPQHSLHLLCTTPREHA